MLQAPDEIGPAVLDRVLQSNGIGRQEIRRRENVEELPRGELDDVAVLLSHAVDAGRRVVPPLLLKQERLIAHIVGPPLPLRGREPLVLRQRLDARASA